MNRSDWTLLALGALVACGATLLTGQFLGEAGSPRAQAAPNRSTTEGGDADDSTRIERLAKTLSELREHQDELQQTLARLDSSPRPDQPAAPRFSPEELAEAVSSWMEIHRAELLATLEEPGTLSDERRRETDRAVAIIQSGDWPEEGEAAFWRSLRDSGRLDEVITVLEETVDSSPYDADLRVDLATAYGQKVYGLSPGPLQSMMRRKQDEAFDAALEVVPNHWEARFGKAMGLSEWPTFLGKTSESIHQLEQLVDQQERTPSEERHMQTYFFLGNLYRESGREEEALSMWNRGLARFPGTSMLEDQVRSLTERGGQ